MKIRFYLKKGDLNKAGEQPIRADINIRGVRLQRLIGYTISDKKWDGEAEQVRKGCINEQGKDYRVINSRINEIKSHFTSFDLKLDDKPSMEQMSKEFEKAINKNAARIAAISNKDSEEVVEEKVAEAETKEKKPKVKPAVEYMDEFIREESRLKEWSLETLKMVKSFKNHLLKFKKTAGLDFSTRTALTNSSHTSVPMPAWKRTLPRSSTRTSPGSSAGLSVKATPRSATWRPTNPSSRL